MKTEARLPVNLFRSGGLAFVVVVAASYVSAATALASSRRALTAPEAALLIAAGALYLFAGTYGFSYCRRTRSLRASLSYFVAQLSLAAVLINVGGAGMIQLILLPLAGQGVVLLPGRWAAAVCAAIYVILLLPVALRSSWVGAVTGILIYGTGIIFVVVFTQTAVGERNARAELAEANRRLREHAAQVEELATAKERNRLAREIHDTLGHYLTVVNVNIEAARAVFQSDPRRAQDLLGKAQKLTQEGLGEVRRSVAALRSSSRQSRPLAEAVAGLVEDCTSPGLRAELKVEGEASRLSPQSELTLYRAAQEALTNVRKHARASRVSVRLDYRPDGSVRLTVEDDGAGAAHADGGFGLLGVRERAQLLGGEARVRTAPGAGFALEVELPG